MDGENEEGRTVEKEVEGVGNGVSEAFRCPEANLLPDTKFIGNGLFIKCLGQVDLPNAPLRHHSPHSQRPPPPSPPDFLWYAVVCEMFHVKHLLENLFIPLWIFSLWFSFKSTV